jgi:hypothetical protein
LNAIRWFAAVLVVSTLCVAPVSTAAQTQTDSTLGPFITAEQARDAFTTAGYMADPIVDWEWRTPAVHTLVRTFEVHDGTTERVLMVLVFPSVEATGYVRGTLAVHGGPERSDPLLVASYGPSAWKGNVALVESTEPILARAAQLQSAQKNGMFEDPSASPDFPQPDIPVDLDFQQALNNSEVNL